eukprot:JP447063.1.p1 GENE.JP447063.1~~JP447063.1.p1  ORF type:complete len:193 (+),score=85.91 JP447063.1:58-636(+)
MKVINSSDTIDIPEQVTVEIKSRKVRVKGPRGTLTKDLSHINLDICVSKDKKSITVERWNGGRRDLAVIRTVCSHFKNMFTGVLKGYQTKMKFVYAHFPVNANITPDNKVIEIRNFLGEKIVRRVECQPGVTVERSDPQKAKDEIILTSNDIEALGITAAQIHQSCLVKNKDIRKFLDGVYVSEKLVMGQDE